VAKSKSAKAAKRTGKDQATRISLLKKTTAKSTKKLEQKFIFVTGGVVSSIGKGLTAASLGTLLEARGLKVTIMKFDPYSERRPGNNVAASARRSFCHRRWSRNRS
jgi:uncharacterized NAD-dependent epimerase/dehydratase family protein